MAGDDPLGPGEEASLDGRHFKMGSSMNRTNTLIYQLASITTARHVRPTNLPSTSKPCTGLYTEPLPPAACPAGPASMALRTSTSTKLRRMPSS